MAQLSLQSRFNKNLFSNHYLDTLIQGLPEWKKTEHEELFWKIKKLYNGEKIFLESLNEAQLEDRFLRPVFRLLLHEFEVQETTKVQGFPDYAFFKDSEIRDEAHRMKGQKSFYNNAFAVGEVKRWGVELDRLGRDKHDKHKNPSFQLWLYLQETEPKWGILSNGRKWRLYRQDKLFDCYYEIDLVNLLETDDVEGFRYFYYFFRKEAFLPSDVGKTFLEEVLQGSADYAREIGDNLKENVYKSLKIIADGFFHWPGNNLDYRDERTRADVQKSTMRLLYRFLFLLYAEGKGLLDLRDERYLHEHSFQRLKEEIQNKKEGPSQTAYSPVSTSLWDRLKNLFLLINEGSGAFAIPKEEFYVPAYNGGLFDPKKNPHLNEWKIGDSYLAEAVDLLARS